MCVWMIMILFKLCAFIGECGWLQPQCTE